MRTVTRRLFVAAGVTVLALGGAGAGVSAAGESGGFTVGEVPPDGPRYGYDARTVFRGVFFNQGPVARALPEAAGTPEVDGGVVERAIDEVEARQPGIVESFADAVRSGSLVRTREELDEAGALVREVLADAGNELAADPAAAHPPAGPHAVPPLSATGSGWDYTGVGTVTRTREAYSMRTDELVYDLVVTFG